MRALMCATAVFAATASAEVVNVWVVDGDEQPVSGIRMIALDEDGDSLGTPATTNARGLAYVTTPQMPFVLRVTAARLYHRVDDRRVTDTSDIIITLERRRITQTSPDECGPTWSQTDNSTPSSASETNSDCICETSSYFYGAPAPSWQAPAYDGCFSQCPPIPWDESCSIVVPSQSVRLHRPHHGPVYYGSWPLRLRQ